MNNVSHVVTPSGHFIAPPNGKKYPLQMIDPAVFSSSDAAGILHFFRENGYVVVDQISEAEHRKSLIERMDTIVRENILNSRRLGFMDLYHDNTLAKLRQNPRLYNVFTTLFGTEKLWVVFDRVIYQTPNEPDDPLNPHVDQNPLTHPEFFNVQAMLALHDMNELTGTLALVPKSPQFFQDYAAWAKPKDGFVENQGEKALPFVGVRVKEGQIIIWDSRTTHSRFRGEPKGNRYAALLTFTRAKDDPELVSLRLKYFEEGIGFNHHEAGLRATSRPRCEVSLRKEKEELTDLGRKLYGIESWKVK